VFVLETIQTDGISQLSYLVADTDSRRAAVIDPRTDVEIYGELAKKHGVSITHVIETHIHADFVSGSRSLAKRVGTARIYLSGIDSNYEFEGERVTDGHVFEFGSFSLTARHTPGHTPEHLSYEIRQSGRTEPWAVFTGDSLFVGSAGRPDLLGDEHTKELTEALYGTLYDYYLKLDDFLTIFPGHGAGSACGASIGDRLLSTIGYERRTNPFLRYPSFEAFSKFIIDDSPPVPHHYPELKKVNSAGPEVVHRLPTVRALPPHAFRQEARKPGVTVVDTRSKLAFGAGHVPGAINIGFESELSVWVGQMFDLDQQLLLVVEHESDLDDVQRLIIRSGHSNFAGYLCGGMKAWEVAALPMDTVEQVHVDRLRELQEEGGVTILDVRTRREWEAGHVPGARHYYVADMKDRIDGLDKSSHYVAYCASGYRASIASSLMQARGFKQVSNVPGSWQAWSEAGHPVAKPEGAEV